MSTGSQQTLALFNSIYWKTPPDLLSSFEGEVGFSFGPSPGWLLSNLEQHLATGRQALEEERYREAALSFAAVVTLLPSEWSIWQMAAQAWNLAGDRVREREAWRGAYAHWAGEDVRNLFGIGAGLLQCGAPFEATTCLERVAAALPRDSSALGALAAAYRSSGQLTRAWRTIQRALTISPRSPTLCLTAAQIRHAQGNLADAHRWLDKADRLRPNHGPTQLQRGLTTLLAGPSAPGWAGFEERGLPSCHSGGAPWRGESLTGASIVVLAEQGVGDLFHFLRFIPVLADRGPASLIVEAHGSTHALLERNGLTVVNPGNAPKTDWCVPVLSLPHVLGIDGDYVTNRFPYVVTGDLPSPSRRRPSGRPRIGVTWKGNPGFLATALRDFNFALLPELSSLMDAEWISLQLDEPVPEGFQNAGVRSPDWLETARLLESLDCVISVDTAIAHLAGAMGLSPIVLLPYSPDWRWGLASATTAWYPGMQLIRQAAPNEWRSVLPELQRTIYQRFAPGSPRS